MEQFEVIEDRPHPSGASTVSDLVRASEAALVSEKVTYRRLAEPANDPRYYCPAQMGDYTYVPSFSNRPSHDQHPRVPRHVFRDYRSLASMGEIKIEFKSYQGSLRLASFYSGWATGLYLISDDLLDVVLRFDPDGLEIATPSIVGECGAKLEGYRVVMPTRVIDATDITRTDIAVQRYVRRPEVGPSVSIVDYGHGPVLRDDISAPTFVETYGGQWFWSLEIIHAVVAAGIRGIRFVHPYHQSMSTYEIRLPAEGDLRYSDDR